MLAKQFRLPAKERFTKSFISTLPYLTIRVRPNTFSYNRFGFVISKKVAKSAVVRNSMKRLLREAVTEFLFVSAGKDILLIVKNPFTKEEREEIKAYIQKSLQHI